MERFLRVDGLKVRYLEHGQGAPVILLHGASLGSSADVWTRNLPALAAHRLRVIAPDLPGFGATDNPRDSSVGYRRRFVGAFMDALDIPRASLVGHSQSGRVAVDLAFEAPPRIAKAVVLGTGSLLPTLPGNSEPAAEGEEGAVSEPTLDESRRLLESNLYHRHLATEDAVALRHRMSLGKNFEAFAARRSSRGANTDKGGEAAWQRLARCPVPLLLIYGENDRGEAARRAALAKELSPELDLRLLPQCAHLVQWDAATAFAELAGSFLTSST